jgi:sugar phosphate isomerase/epimerase
MPSFSLAALTALELAPPELVDVAAACGYDHVGIRLLPATPGGLAYRLMDDEASLRETIARLDATGVTVADLEVVAIRPETGIASFSAFFETGARLGARHILVAAYDPELNRFAERFARFCEAAAPHGLTADLEFMPWTKVPNAKTALRIVTNAARPNGRILVDALHAGRSATTLADIAAIPRAMLSYAQLCDAPAEIPATHEGLIHTARFARLLPGEGGIDLVGMLSQLPAGLPISLEIPNAERLPALGAEEWGRQALAAAKTVVAKRDALAAQKTKAESR